MDKAAQDLNYQSMLNINFKLTIFLLSIFSLVCQPQKSDSRLTKYSDHSDSLIVKSYSGETPPTYLQKLTKVVDSISSHANISVRSIEAIIPATGEEMLEYYNLTFNDSTYKYFSIIDSVIVKNAADNKYGFLPKYLMLNQFVDGEYADGYFDNLENIIIRNKKNVCRIYSNLPIEKVKRIQNLMRKYCK
ncbi:hypothetical protein [Solitalea canadensis]|nr:hypothetical protein [Solitalea canadensis]